MTAIDLTSINYTAATISVLSSIFTAVIIVVVTDWRKRKTDDIKIVADRAKIASDREIEARAEFVELMQQRVGELERQLDQLRQGEGVLVMKFREDYNALERRYRHLVAGLVTYSAILKVKLSELKVEVPPFDGWSRFMNEGGTPREEWRNPDLGGIC